MNKPNSRQPSSANDPVSSWIDHQEIVDALYRFAAGQDLRDAALFESAFADDATLDFVQPAARFGVTLAPFQGKRAISDIVMTTTAPLHTTHTVTNPRASIDGDHAELTALVEAPHVTRNEPRRSFLLKNIYRVRLGRAGARWLIKHLHIENVWHEGDSTVLLKAA